MTKKERNLIENKIKQFRKWAEEEEREYKKAQTREEKNDHFEQMRLNDTAANTLENLLSNLEDFNS